MKRNKIFSILTMVVIVLSTAVTLSSCSKDDSKDSDYNKTSKIVGTWKSDDGILVTFNANGTGKLIELDEYEEYIGGFRFLYTYDDKTCHLTILSEAGYEEEDGIIKWINNNTFVIGDIVYRKQ